MVGQGLYEWTNVAKALPNFDGHYQPHLPDELGYYDFDFPKYKNARWSSPKNTGSMAFVSTITGSPEKGSLNVHWTNIVANPDLDLPFCLCWANENWTRRWDGAEHEILIAQDYKEQEYQHFIHDIASHFMDPRYIRVEGKPILLVYRINRDPGSTNKPWRFGAQNAEKWGLVKSISSLYKVLGSAIPSLWL